MEVDLANPSFDHEKNSHKLKRLVQAPNSYFMDVKCPSCPSVSTVFSNAQSTVTCEGCNHVLGKPTGGKCKLSVGSAYRVKQN